MPLLDQEFDPDTLPALRAALSAHALEAGLAEELAGDLVLAVHELAANAIAHGAGYGHLRLWHLPGALSCEITDGRPAPAQCRFRPARRFPRVRRAAPRRSACGRFRRHPGRLAGHGGPRPLAGAAAGRPAGPVVGPPR